MKNIEFKPAKKAAETKKIRVAAYCRTSGDSDEAQHSLETQKKHFKDYIEGQKDWILVDIYADNAVSGTLYERPEFQRMLKDCRDGEIDLVITKSITRFARNTLVTLKTLRELKVLGIRCIFENEHLDTDTEIGEFLFTVFAVNAESTSESASENQKWRIEKLYEQGKVAGGRYMGYRIKDSALVVEPKEASIIKDIYELYLSGKGYGRIAEYLNRKKIPASYGGCWSPSTIRGILTNEIYIGNLVLQKMFREDFRTKKLVRNNGQKKMFKVEKVHEAIIDKKTFQAVQDEIKRRGEKQKLIMQDKKREERLFTGMIQCQQCGSSFIRKRPNRGRNKPFWALLHNSRE